MRNRGDDFLPRSRTGRRNWMTLRMEGVISFVMFWLVAASAAIVYFPGKRESAQWLLLYGAATYAIATIAALLTRVVASLSLRPLRLVIGSLLVAFLTGPTFLGSMAIVFALVQLVGNRAEGSDAMLGLVLWAAVSLPLLVFARQRAANV